VLVVAQEKALTTRQDLAVRCDADLGVGNWLTNGFAIDCSVTVDNRESANFGLTVDLLQIDAECPKEAQRVGPERRTAGIRAPEPGQPELIANGCEDEPLGDRMFHAMPERFPSRLELRVANAYAPRINAPFQPVRVRGFDRNRRRQVLPDARRGE